MKRKLRLAILLGGPSPERGISLNSARSVCDHLDGDDLEIVPIYFDYLERPYLVSRAQLYSNTPSDFDFKLMSETKPLSRPAFHRLLKGADLAFPVMHGKFGEDGGIQKILESLKVPFVGPSSDSCIRCFDKFNANETIRANGFYALPSMVCTRGQKGIGREIGRFFQEHRLKRAIVKPATGGSSIGVFSVSTAREATEAAQNLLSDKFYKRVVVEQFCEGREFTSVILQNRFSQPVCLVPVEIEADYAHHQIFDFRKKYLATRQVTYHLPPRFEDEIVERIQIQAEQLFQLFGLRDFSRFDGWLTDKGDIWFSDFNPISGMEQNSFLFLQSARIGMTHRDVLRYIVGSACRRYGIRRDLFASEPQKSASSPRRKKLNVLFGGPTAERQVSVMSGTNVWLKLRQSKTYEPSPFLLDADQNVWKLPYAMTLNHTVEEITEVCRKARAVEARESKLRARVQQKLAALPGQLSLCDFTPEEMTLKEFLKRSERVFIGLHGGIGENGVLQSALDKAHIPYNGSDSKTSHLCMDKFETSKRLAGLEKEGIYTARKALLGTSKLQAELEARHAVWELLVTDLESETLIVKPNDDGCSAGIARLYSAQDLRRYVDLLQRRVPRIPPKTLTNQRDPIEMPVRLPQWLLFEEFIETDRVRVKKNKLKWNSRTNWIEMTVGVTGRRGALHALNPSITVAMGDVLSVEEKFQGGTGVNISPPPPQFVSRRVVALARKRIEKVAKILGIRGYARIDAFLNIKTAEIIVIEANTLPALTGSTVIFQQALVEAKPLFPREFLERLVGLSG